MQCICSLGLGHKLHAVIPVAGQRTFQALKVASQVATPGVESAVYDCLVCCSNELIGRFETTVRELSQGPGAANEYPVGNARILQNVFHTSY